MFSKPFLDEEDDIPTLPIRNKEFQMAVRAAIGKLPDSLHDPTLYLKNYALDNWLLLEDLKKVPGNSLSYNKTPEYQAFKAVGMTDRITPQRSTYDHVLIDGGVKPVLDYRLRYLDTLIKDGLKSDSITLFGGQKLRKPDDDSGGRLEECAQRLRSTAQPWLKDWLETELSKNPNNPDKWQRPFATEHEIALFALLEWGGKELRHIKTGYRKISKSIHKSIPLTGIAYEDFQYGHQSIRVLNALAIRRKFIERQLPLKESRPTGGSCFKEWLIYANPKPSASVLLITHNPDIYRSWLDIMIVAQESGRPDLLLEGAGDMVQSGTLYGEIIQSFGRVLVNFYLISRLKSG